MVAHGAGTYRSSAGRCRGMKVFAKTAVEDCRLEVPVCEPLAVESWPYDGDTPQEQRNALRQAPPPILLANPEYLNIPFLAWRDQWQSFLLVLRFVVIDEMHAYRGFFGGNVALLMRRFFLQLARLGCHPRIFLSTATCANPQEHAKNLTGRDDMHIVFARNVLRPRLHFTFVDPDIPDYRYRDILQLRIEQASLAYSARGFRLSSFVPQKDS